MRPVRLLAALCSSLVVSAQQKPLTPADVVFSIMRHKNPATGSRAKALADQIEEVTATGPNEVTIVLADGAPVPGYRGLRHQANEPV